MTITKERLAELLANLRANKAMPAVSVVSEPESTETIITISPPAGGVFFEAKDRYGRTIILNERQQEFVSLAASGKSCVLIGAAGTGKTTCQGTAVQNLIHSGKAGILSSDGHKHLTSGTPGIVVCAYTRRAVANIRKNMPGDMQANCITIHKLLEYQPVYYDAVAEDGELKTKMTFEATRNAHRPLPSSIRVIIFEETSMLGTDLYMEVMNACPHDVQIVFLGDIQQLPPVFGPAILGFKLLELPVVELTEVYRQALESPIISLAHRTLSGKPLPVSEFPEWKYEGKLTIHAWKKKIEPIAALNTAGQFFIAAETKGAYNPEEDMILIPFNKAFGTDELNKIIANHLAKKSGEPVYQIVAGFNRVYFRVGEKVLYDKEDAIITKIDKNPAYAGAAYLAPSPTLDYWGHDSESHKVEDDSDDSVDFLLQQVAMSETGEDRVKKCSHRITLQMRDSETEVTVDTAGDVNAMLYGYALTVHKAQGSEWRKVFFVCHQSHATMLQRELLYTAITRAKEELYIICEPETFVNGIKSQRVKGNTLAEKAEFFKGKIDSGFVLEGK
jgi:exodeoxyribonuclease V alpha subunit